MSSRKILSTGFVMATFAVTLRAGAAAALLAGMDATAALAAGAGGGGHGFGLHILGPLLNPGLPSLNGVPNANSRSTPLPFRAIFPRRVYCGSRVCSGDFAQSDTAGHHTKFRVPRQLSWRRQKRPGQHRLQWRLCLCGPKQYERLDADAGHARVAQRRPEGEVEQQCVASECFLTAGSAPKQ